MNSKEKENKVIRLNRLDKHKLFQFNKQQINTLLDLMHKLGNQVFMHSMNPVNSLKNSMYKAFL